MRVNDSQAYRKMGVTSERISRIFELREILLSFQTGFNSHNAAAVCGILESISGLEPSSLTEPKYLKLVTVSSFCPFTLISVLMPLVLFVISLVFTVAHKAACQTLSKAFLKSMKTWERSCWCWRHFRSSTYESSVRNMYTQTHRHTHRHTHTHTHTHMHK